MRDMSYTVALDNDDRIASGSVKVIDYEKFVGAQATGSIEVLDYEALVAQEAEGDIVITDYTGLVGKTVTIGTNVLEEGSGKDFEAATDNATTAESLKDAIHALSGITATRSTATITVKATAGTAGNAIVVQSN